MSGFPVIIGRPAAGLNNAKWAASAGAAKAGTDGELRTAALLNRIAADVDGPTVLHDVRIPLPNVSANIDHVIVSGSTITIIDSKLWKPAFYWSVFGRSFRGTESFPHASKQTMVMAYDALVKHAEEAGINVQMAQPWLVVWPSKKYPKMNLRFLKATGAKAVTGDAFTRKAKRVMGKKSADPEIVSLLIPLVASTDLSVKSVSRSVTAPSYIEEPSFTDGLIVRRAGGATPFDDDTDY